MFSNNSFPFCTSNKIETYVNTIRKRVMVLVMKWGISFALKVMSWLYLIHYQGQMKGGVSCEDRPVRFLGMGM